MYLPKTQELRNALYDDYEPDHIIPWPKSDSTAIGNAQITHKICNRKKYNITA